MKKYDVIVVGAGPSGSAAALVLARAGMDVVLVERGEYPGEKNMFGGALYGSVLNELVPSYWEEAPVERVVYRKGLTFLTDEDSFNITYDGAGFSEPPNNGYIVRRNLFDRWFAAKAIEAGAFLVNRTVIRDVIRKDGKVIGVMAARDQGEMYADVVIAADGAVSLLAKKAGLRRDLQPHHFNVGVKETIQLSKNTIDERFNLTGSQGVANEFLTQGIHGGGFIYTNKETLSVGVVSGFASLTENRTTIYAVLDAFKQHPAVRGLIRDGVVREYSAHMIPEGGLNMAPELYTDGMLVVGDAAGFTLVTGWAVEGVNHAVSSGIAAAEAVKEAAAKRDFSKASLARYRTILEKRCVLKDLKTFKNAPAFLRNPGLYEVYPEFVCSMAERLFTVDGQAKAKLLPLFAKQLKEKVGIRQAVKDGFQAGRALLW